MERIFSQKLKKILQKSYVTTLPRKFCVSYIYLIWECSFMVPIILPSDYSPQFPYACIPPLTVYWKFSKTFRITLFQGERRGVLSWCCFIPTRWCCFCFLVKSFILEHPHFSTYQENTYSIYISFYMGTLGERAHCGGLISSHSCQKLP